MSKFINFYFFVSKSIIELNVLLTIIIIIYFNYIYTKTLIEIINVEYENRKTFLFYYQSYFSNV